jgi:hypothetical protein
MRKIREIVEFGRVPVSLGLLERIADPLELAPELLG